MISCADGATAVAQARAALPDVIVASAALRDMTALDVAHAVRALDGGDAVPVIVTTPRAVAERPRAGDLVAEVLIEPLAPGRLIAAVRAQLARRRSRVAGGGRHILVADDDPALLKLARVLLERRGFRVTAAPDVASALAAAAATPPDAVLSDVRMPDADGFELCVRLHQVPGLAKVPVVLVSSASHEPADIELAARIGAVALCRRTSDLAEPIAALVGALGDPQRSRATSA